MKNQKAQVLSIHFFDFCEIIFFKVHPITMGAYNISIKHI